MIQGFASKFALQHFARNAMFNIAPDWFCFDSKCSVPLWQNQNGTRNAGTSVTQTFYGISQGGILGAGYTALSGPTNLIDRSALNVPGTVSVPFSQPSAISW
jgi:hypothetical protein